jgi:hypothetical protein
MAGRALSMDDSTIYGGTSMCAGGRMLFTGRQKGDPTPEDIAAITADIRRT